MQRRLRLIELLALAKNIFVYQATKSCNTNKITSRLWWHSLVEGSTRSISRPTLVPMAMGKRDGRKRQRSLCAAALGFVLLASDAGWGRTGAGQDGGVRAWFGVGDAAAATVPGAHDDRPDAGHGGWPAWSGTASRTRTAANPRGTRCAWAAGGGSRRTRSRRAANDRAGYHPGCALRQLRVAARWRGGPGSRRLLMPAGRDSSTPLRAVSRRRCRFRRSSSAPPATAGP